MRAVFVTKEAEALRAAIIKNEASPIRYNSVKPKEIMDEDKVIQNYRVKLNPEDIVVIPFEGVFE